MEERVGSAALDVVRAGGRYRLVLGADLTDAKVRSRRVALGRKPRHSASRSYLECSRSSMPVTWRRGPRNILR